MFSATGPRGHTAGSAPRRGPRGPDGPARSRPRPRAAHPAPDTRPTSRPAPARPDTLPRVSASLTPALGLLVWLAAVVARWGDLGDEASLAEAIVLFVVLVAVPRALLFAVSEDMSPRTYANAARPVVLAGLAGLVAAVPAFLPGLAPHLAAGFTLPWLFACGVAALYGLLRLYVRRTLTPAELALDVGLLWLPGAAVWLLVYRGDLVLGGFGGLAAVLTAGHFHAAGFGALVMTGLLGRGLAGGPAWTRPVFGLTAVALLLAFPALAVGIGAGARQVELAGAGLYVLALPLLALLQLVAAAHLRDRAAWARVLLVLSAGSLLVSTTFAGMFAAQGFYGAAVPILTMLRVHGLLNAVGFLGLGLLAWTGLRAPATRA